MCRVGSALSLNLKLKLKLNLLLRLLTNVLLDLGDSVSHVIQRLNVGSGT